MYTGLLHTHSALRYIVLILLVAVIIIAISGLVKKRPFSGLDNRMSLFLFIATHVQLLVGLLLYILSYTNEGMVRFDSETMSNPMIRYFTVEHVIMMLIAVVLITLGRTGMKKLSDDRAKHRRLLVFNTIALLIIVGTVYGMGGAYNRF